MDKAELDNLVARAQHPLDPPDVWLDGLIQHYIDQVQTRVNYYRFLYLLVHAMKPTLCLELGVETGIASAHMARAAETYGGQVIGIDKLFHVMPAGQIPVTCPNFTFVVSDTTDGRAILAVQEAVRAVGKIGVVFQDSSHHYDPSELEWRYYAPMLADDAVWVCDDITPAFFEPGVDQHSMEVYFDGRPGTKFKYPDVLHYGNTMGVILP